MRTPAYDASFAYVIVFSKTYLVFAMATIRLFLVN